MPISRHNQYIAQVQPTDLPLKCAVQRKAYKQIGTSNSPAPVTILQLKLVAEVECPPKRYTRPRQIRCA